MKLSVAMCTCNGELYLSEQLESLIAQIRRPDELVICDDRSTDSTVEIIEAFASARRWCAASCSPVIITGTPEDSAARLKIYGSEDGRLGAPDETFRVEARRSFEQFKNVSETLTATAN